MSTIYTEFANLPNEIAEFAVGGPDFAGVRASGDGYVTPILQTALPISRLVFIAAALETFGRTFPEALIWNAPWLVFALLGVDVQVQNVFSDGTLAYLITGQPVTHYGFVLGPAAPTNVPAGHARRPLAQGLQIGLRIGLA